MAARITRAFLFLLSYVLVVTNSEGLNLVAYNVTVALREPALLNCTLTDNSEPGDVSILVRKTAGFYTPDNDILVGGFSRLVLLESAQYSDNGQYICTARVNDSVSSEIVTITATFYVSIQGYTPPRKQSTGLFGLVRSSEQSLVSCPVEGVPGPVNFYWERGNELNTTGYTRVAMATNVTSGPFVNKQGQLDLTLATKRDSMFYLCTGVDVAGASASQLFRVEVVVQDVFVLWIQWYMILVYCVVGVIIVIVTVLVVWYICANRHEWCVKVTKKEVVKKRVRREELTEVFQPPPPLVQNVDLDSTFFETYKGGYSK